MSCGTDGRTGVVCTGLWDTSDVQSCLGNDTVTISVFRKSVLLFGDMASHGKFGSTRLLAYSFGIQQTSLYVYPTLYVSNFRMEPEENPYAALLAIDVPAMKSREYEYLVDLRDSHEWIDETGYLLNVHYTAALADYMLEKDAKKNHSVSSESLSQAIQRFPWLIAQLFYTLKITFPPDFPTTVPPSQLQSLYTDLYIHRSKDLWTAPEISTWLQSVAKQTASKVVEPKPSHTADTIPLNVARHIFVMNVPALMSHIPREYTSRTQLASDPLPPGGSVSPYDALMRSLPGLARDESALNRWIQGIVRGGGNEEDVEEEEDDDDDDDDDDDGHLIGEEEEPNETLVAQLTNAIRNTFSWFGGGRHVLDADEEEHEAHDDGEGVD